MTWTQLQQDDYWASKIQAMHICDVLFIQNKRMIL